MAGSAAPFVHLRVHSAYSLLEGALPIPTLISLCQEHAFAAVALTDTNNMFGALEFAEAAVKAGVQPIIGCSLSVNFDDGEEARRGAGRRTLSSRAVLALLAKDDAGYANLMRLSSLAFTQGDGEGETGIPVTALGDLSGGLVALTGGPDGPIDQALAVDDEERARARMAMLRPLFDDRLYFEIQRHGVTDREGLENDLVSMAYEFGLPLVATNEAYFPTSADHEAHDALICIAEGSVIAAEDRRHLTADHWFKPAAAMAELFEDLPEAVANTNEIAHRCAVRPRVRAPILPRVGREGKTVDEAAELRRQAEAGLRFRLQTSGPYGEIAEDEYWRRLEHELAIIIEMDYPGYFLIVSDIIKWTRGQGIPVGPGRGSGAASVVAWALTITDLDPLRFNLVFERFLNPHRVSMPDFDIDFCPERRDEVIGHIRDTYGHDRVAQIITFGKLQARAVLRDVGRVLQMPYGQVDRLCKLVPNNPANPVTLAQAIDGEERLRAERDGDETVARLLQIGLKLEGLYRHASTHAAGVVIGDQPLDQLVPLYRDPRADALVTQFNMKWVEQAGLVKFDILGLKTLTVLQTASRLLHESGVDIDIERVALDDPATYALLGRGDTAGIFQFESGGMRDLLVKARPDRFEDLIALVALFRPGPMENIPKYLACKHGEEEQLRLHPLIESVVQDTYGVIIYQEQVLQIAQKLAGYSLGEADLLRRAMGKKIKAEMDAQRARFVEGAGKNGVGAKQAETIFNLVDKFAGYGFNKAHSAAYALVAYQTAFLKANHPVAFLAASMTHDMGNTEKLAMFRGEAERMGIAVLAPSINESDVEFRVVGGTIRYALAALKNVGRQAVEHLVDQRRVGGPFESVGDFAARIDPHEINRRALEGLVRAGAFDALDPNRARLLQGADAILRAAQHARQSDRDGAVDLFAGEAGARKDDLNLPQCKPWDPLYQLNEEFEVVGSFISGHPLDAHRGVLARTGVQTWLDFQTAVLEQGHEAGRLAGVVTARRDRRSRSGTRFAFVEFSDSTGVFEAVAFSDVLDGAGEDLAVGKALIIQVEADRDGDRPRLRIQSARSLDMTSVADPVALRVFVRDDRPLEALAQAVTAEGQDTMSIVIMDVAAGREVELSLGRRCQITASIAGSIKALPGVVAVEQVETAANTLLTNPA